MTVAAFSLDLRRSRTLVTWLAVITAAYAGFISIFYTNVVENAAQFEQLLEAYPKELLAAFGIGEGSFADPGIFLTGYIYNFLWPLVAAIVAIAVATRVAGDAGRGFLDVVLSTRLSRTAATSRSRCSSSSSKTSASFCAKCANTVVGETSAASAISRMLTLSKPRSRKSIVATSEIVFRVAAFLRSRRPMGSVVDMTPAYPGLST